MKRRGLVWATLLSVVCVSCGGSDGMRPTPVEVSKLVLSPGTGFNGDTSPMSAKSTDTLIASSHMTITDADMSRTLRLWLPTDQMVPGTTISLTGAATSRAYLEERQGEELKGWISSSGTATISNGPNGTVLATLDMSFAPDDTLSNNPAQGTFSLRGQLSGMPDPHRVGQTQVAVTFSNAEGFNGSAQAFPTSAVIGAGVTQQNGLRIAASTTGALARALVAQMDGHTAGDSISLTTPSGHEYVTYTETTVNTVKQWRAVSGTLTLSYIKLAGGKFLIANARFEPDDSVLDNTAAGSFTLNGTLEKG